MSDLSDRFRGRRAMVFLDYRNIVSAIDPDISIAVPDLARLVRILVGSRELVGAYVYDGRPHVVAEGDPVDTEHRALREAGFRVVARDCLVQREGRTEQKEVDVALACGMVRHALLDHYDAAILVSGDRDFVPAMQEVQSAGKTVEVASFGTQCSGESRRSADSCRILDSLPFLRMRTSSVTPEEDERCPPCATSGGR